MPGSLPACARRLSARGHSWNVGFALAVACLAVPAHAGSLSGYASATSVAALDTLGLHVSGTSPSLTLRCYRIGAARTLMLEVPGLVPENVPAPDSSWVKGCGWPTLYTLTVPADWPSGMYDAELDPDDSVPIAHVPFVVRGSATAPNPVLVLSAVNTYQAYNNFGTKSLYDFNSVGGRAARVTFDRPYLSRAGLGQPQFEQPFVRWYEGAGFTADYATDVDLALSPAILDGRRLLVVVGHNEYWSATMLDAVEAFADSTGNVAVLGGNTAFWATRYEAQGRTLVCYKSRNDPMWPDFPESTTVTWRDGTLGRPECRFFGVMYPYCGGTAADSLLFTRPYSWITDGLESNVGERFGRQTVGYEFDTYFNLVSPAGAIRLFETPIAGPGCAQVQASTYYERRPAFGVAGTGGGIFNAGTIQWSWGLASNEGGGAPDPRMQFLTANLLRGLSQRLALTADDTLVVRAALTGPSLTAQLPLTVTARAVEPDSGSFGTYALLDDGVWPDSLADDSVYTGLVPLPAATRLPLELTYDSPSRVLHTGVRRDYFWPSDTRRDGAFAWRFVDTLSVEPLVNGVPPGGPVGARLLAAPNPFRGTVRLSWEPGFEVRRVTIHDARGRRVAEVSCEQGATGATWDGRDLEGRSTRAGLYWARAEGPRGVRNVRVVRLR
ncbi:MAG: N,N-dimethylformamidase beta subunit family domain-containing protein [Candidatus Eisenbacteria bacterium]